MIFHAEGTCRCRKGSLNSHFLPKSRSPNFPWESAFPEPGRAESAYPCQNGPVQTHVLKSLQSFLSSHPQISPSHSPTIYCPSPLSCHMSPIYQFLYKRDISFCLKGFFHLYIPSAASLVHIKILNKCVCFPPINLSCVGLIFRPATEPERVEDVFFSPAGVNNKCHVKLFQGLQCSNSEGNGLSYPSRGILIL